jgi:hypothetical protein
MRFILGLLALASPAYADEPPDLWSRAHIVAAGHVSIGDGPFGVAGAEVEVSPLPFVAVAVGTGDGIGGSFWGAGATHVATVEARWRALLSPRMSLMFGVGYERSNWVYEDHPFGESPYSVATWDRVNSVQADVGLDIHKNHAFIRFYAGVRTLVSVSAPDCEVLREGGDCMAAPGPHGGTFVGIAAGGALGL